MILKSHEVNYIRPRCETTRIIQGSKSYNAYLVGKSESTVIVNAVRPEDKTGTFLIEVDSQNQNKVEQLHNHIWKL